MNLQNSPELADGGYWYVLPIVPDPERGGQTPGVVPGLGCTVVYSGIYAVVRTPEPVLGLPTVDVVISDLITDPKPYGRVGGA